MQNKKDAVSSQLEQARAAAMARQRAEMSVSVSLEAHSK